MIANIFQIECPRSCYRAEFAPFPEIAPVAVILNVASFMCRDGLCAAPTLVYRMMPVDFRCWLDCSVAEIAIHHIAIPPALTARLHCDEAQSE
jgi:hypothetical protein